jgi:hypothetical protein
MGRPRKPTALLEAAGAFKRNPERRRSGEPTPREGIGPAPEGRPPAFISAWNELVADCCPHVLGNSDRHWLELTAELLCEFRENPREITAARLRLLTSCLTALGMSPSARASLTTIPEPEEVDPVAHYFD